MRTMMKNIKTIYSFKPNAAPTVKVMREGVLMARTPMKFEKTTSERKVLEFMYTTSTDTK